jgi:hypothetical protein
VTTSAIHIVAALPVAPRFRFIERILDSRAPAGPGRGGGADGLAGGASAAAGVAVLIRLTVDGPVLFGADVRAAFDTMAVTRHCCQPGRAVQNTYPP